MKEYARLAAVFCMVVLLIPMAAAGVIGGRIQQNARKVLSELGEEYLLYLDEATGKVERIATIDYVRGAIAAEMPPTFHPEALAAQGLSAHTRAVYLKNLAITSPDPALKGAYFSANPSQNEGFVPPEQMQALYGDNYAIYYAAIDKAAAYAKDRLITFEGQPILAAYHAMSNGTTEESGNVWQQSLPYLAAVASEGDTLAPDYKAEVRLPLEQADSMFMPPTLTSSFPTVPQTIFIFWSARHKTMSSRHGWATESFQAGSCARCLVCAPPVFWWRQSKTPSFLPPRDMVMGWD